MEDIRSKNIAETFGNSVALAKNSGRVGTPSLNRRSAASLPKAAELINILW